MRRLFIQFYLLLIGCFTLAILLVGMVYQVTAERAGDRYLERMMQGSLGLLTGELARLPPEHWPARMAEQSRQLTLPLQIGALANQPLANEDQAFLEAGNIVIVEEDDTFLQRIPGTDQVLIVGPVPYLSYLHELHWVDVGLLLLIGLSLGLPILLWLRPHWRGLQQLEQTARRVGDGDLSCRTRLPPGSSLGRVGRTFDQMTEQLQAMLASRKQLTDAIAHELRTPLVRLRYRLAMLDPAPSAEEQQRLERDLGALDALIEEMLTYARLDRPELPLQCSELELGRQLGRQPPRRLAGAAAGQAARLRAPGHGPALARRYSPAGSGAGEPHRQRPAPRRRPGDPQHGASAGSLSAGGSRRWRRHRSRSGAADLRALRAAGSEPRPTHRRRRAGGAGHRAQHRPPPRRRGAAAAEQQRCSFLPDAACTFGYKPSPVTH